MTWRNSKIGTGVISSTESESKNQNIFVSSDSVYNSITYDPMKTRLSEVEAEEEEPTNHMARN